MRLGSGDENLCFGGFPWNPANDQHRSHVSAAVECTETLDITALWKVIGNFAHSTASCCITTHRKSERLRKPCMSKFPNSQNSRFVTAMPVRSHRASEWELDGLRCIRISSAFRSPKNRFRRALCPCPGARDSVLPAKPVSSAA